MESTFDIIRLIQNSKMQNYVSCGNLRRSFCRRHYETLIATNCVYW